MRKKSRHKPRAIQLDTMALAAAGARKLDPIHIANIAAIIDRAWSHMQSGEDRPKAVHDIAYAANIAGELSSIGICSDDESKRKTEDAQEVIARWAESMNDWSQLAISEDDAFVMDEAVFIWKVQLQYCSLGEFERARRNVNVVLEQAKRGNIGSRHRVIRVNDQVK